MNKTFCSFVMLVMGCIVAVAADGRQEPTYVSYNQFIAELDSGAIKSVELDQYSQITGTRVLDGVESSFSCYADTGSSNDVLLLRLLHAKGVQVRLKPQDDRDRGPGFLFGLSFTVLPLATLILVALCYRRLRKLQSGSDSTPRNPPADSSIP